MAKIEVTCKEPFCANAHKVFNTITGLSWPSALLIEEEWESSNEAPVDYCPRCGILGHAFAIPEPSDVHCGANRAWVLEWAPLLVPAALFVASIVALILGMR